MNSKYQFIFSAACLLLVSFYAYSETESAYSAIMIKPSYTEKTPKIDGALDDDIWKTEPIVSGYLISYYPHQGEKLPYLTEVWVAYDEANLYFAFYAHDDEPDKIQSSITKRDNIIPEDWVGVLVNSTGNRMNGYGFYSNPNGIQYDELVTSNGEDYTPDWVWYNGAKMVKNGYTIEFQIPLKSITYESGENVRICLAFFRKISRLGYVTSWPTISPGSNSLRAAADAVYGNLERQIRLEILPSITYSNFWDRESPDAWTEADSQTELGVDLNVGITSSITAEVTINPDFSQVESDTFQILLNQRFPVFFPEKRPFFMELSNQFGLAKSGNSNLITAVHTRKIVDPDWGTKIRGELGNLTFGILAAVDEPLSELETDDNMTKPLFLVGRARYSLGGDNNIGLLFSGQEIGDGYNRVIAADLVMSFADVHNLRGNIIYSMSRDENTADSGPYDGMAFHLNYSYITRLLIMDVVVEHFDENFRMDTAFYERTGITRVAGTFAPNFYPEDSIPWINRISPHVYGDYLKESYSDLEEYNFNLELWLQFPLQGMLFLDYWRFKEIWLGQNFEGDFFRVNAGIQATNWLRLDTLGQWGDRVLYDPSDPILGTSWMLTFSTTIQLSENFSQYISYTYQDLKDPQSNKLVYDVNIITTKTTYQMNKYLFFRATMQYDSSRDLLLTDLLASFTLIPGTVMHLGYGSLHEDRYWLNDQWTTQHELDEFYQTRQSIFFKASYRWQY